VVVTGGREPTAREAVEWCAELAERGAGEILLTSMDRDGSRKGYDLELLRAVSSAVPIPVIASGGAGSLADLAAGLEAGAHGVLAASIFHDQGSSLGEARAYLRSRGFAVRP
jgi:cyclase